MIRGARRRGAEVPREGALPGRRPDLHPSREPDDSSAAVGAACTSRRRRAAPSLCAFNGGNDVFCDIGKRHGVDGLRRLLGLPLASVLHVGDQFLDTGNDYAARVVVPCVWIINEKETAAGYEAHLKDALEIPEVER